MMHVDLVCHPKEYFADVELVNNGNCPVQLLAVLINGQPSGLHSAVSSSFRRDLAPLDHTRLMRLSAGVVPYRVAVRYVSLLDRKSMEEKTWRINEHRCVEEM